MRDGERTIRFGEGSAAEAPTLLRQSGFGEYALLTTERASASVPLEEGATQWLGHATTVRAGLTTTARLRGPYSGTQPERFYQTGPLQLWILEGLRGPKAMRRITASIARSKGPEGSLFPQFARLAR